VRVIATLAPQNDGWQFRGMSPSACRTERNGHLDESFPLIGGIDYMSAERTVWGRQPTTHASTQKKGIGDPPTPSNRWRLTYALICAATQKRSGLLC